MQKKIWGRFRTRRVLATIIVFSSALLITSFGYYASTTDSCRTCHQKDFDGWRNSAHKSIACQKCHGESGTFGIGANSLARAREFALALTKNYLTPITSRVDSRKCLSCHKQNISATISRNGIIMSHKEVISANFACVDCHNTAVHGEAVPIATHPTMEKCINCHNEKIASGKCDVCHTAGMRRKERPKNTVWAVTHGPQWRKTHGMGDLKSCVACHRRQECKKCHGISMPHPPEWPAFHGKRAIGHRSDCRFCHMDSYCRSCHGMKMPHVKNYLQTHSRSAKRFGKATCYRCHFKNDCDDCHERHIHGANTRKRKQ